MAEKDESLQNLASTMRLRGIPADAKATWKSVHGLIAATGGSKWSSPLNSRQNSDGTMADTPLAIRQSVLAHFAQVEAADILDPDILAQRFQLRRTRQ